MRLVFFFIVVFCLSVTWNSQSVLADLVVDSWLLGSGVSSGSYSNSGVSDSVQNPYQQTISGTLGDSYSLTRFDFGWVGDEGHFDAYATQHQVDLLGHTGTAGQIYFIPSVNSIITAHGTWQYAWPNSARGDTDISLIVADLEGKENVVDASAYGGNDGLGPPYGTFDVQDSGLLLAGREYLILYDAVVYFYTATPYGDASGEVHFTITPVPEPATLAFFAPTLLLALRRPNRLAAPP